MVGVVLQEGEEGDGYNMMMNDEGMNDDGMMV